MIVFLSLFLHCIGLPSIMCVTCDYLYSSELQDRYTDKYEALPISLSGTFLTSDISLFSSSFVRYSTNIRNLVY